MGVGGKVILLVLMFFFYVVCILDIITRSVVRQRILCYMHDLFTFI